ncbi:MAG: hypothetical protein MRJ65_13915 [Candidatus Brocadiaceae bacterium]|nr:hypothetical protein [Candidatus Brocadiaceae bacterium]
MTETNNKTGTSTMEDLDSAIQTVCRVCRQSIPAGARICTKCGASQTLWGMVAFILKWAGGVATIVSLLIGMNSLYGIYRGQLEKIDMIREIADAADRLRDDGDYARAWDLYEQAQQLNPASRRVRRGQEKLALCWLPDVSITGDETFTDIVNSTMPVLLLGAGRSSGEEAADFEALIGWAHYLEGRERSLEDVDVPKIYRRALKIDPDNALAHMFLGHWFASNQFDLEAARPHFEAAVQDEKRRSLVRRYQWSALGNMQYIGGTGSRENLAVRKEQVRLAHEMIEQEESFASIRGGAVAVARDVLVAYGPRYRGENFEALWPELTPENHRKLIESLLGELDTDDGAAQQGRFILARIEEKLGNEAAALQLYRTLDAEVGSSYGLRGPIDEAIERLSGEPTQHRLKQQDPIGFHSAALLDTKPGNKEFSQAVATFSRVINNVNDTRNVKQFPQAILALETARTRLTDWLTNHPQSTEPDPNIEQARKDYWTICSTLGSILLTARAFDKAIEVYEKLSTEESPSAWSRAAVFYDLSCAYSLRAETYGPESAMLRSIDVESGVAHLLEAIQAGYDDWDHIKRDHDLDALREHPDYKRVITGQ